MELCRSLRDRQTKLRTDVDLDFVGSLASVRLDDQFLAAEEFQNWLSLGAVVLQSLAQSLFVVITADDQPAATDVTRVGLSRAMVDQVVVESTLAAQPTGQDAFEHDFVGNIDVNDRVDVVALQKEFGLGPCARKSIQDEAEIPVMLRQSATNDFFHGFVIHHLPGSDQAFDSSSQLGVRLDVPAEDIADADVDQVEIVFEAFGLGPLAATLSPHNDKLAHGAFQSVKLVRSKRVHDESSGMARWRIIVAEVSTVCHSEGRTGAKSNTGWSRLASRAQHMARSTGMAAF